MAQRKKTKNTVAVREGQAINKLKEPEAAVTEYHNLPGGVVAQFPADHLDTLAALVAMQSVRGPDARAGLAEATEARDANLKGRAMRDKVAAIEGAFWMADNLFFDDDEERLLEENVALWERRAKAIEAATKDLRGEFALMLNDPEVEQALAKTWAKALNFEPTDETSWGEIQAQKAAAATVAPTITRLYVDYCTPGATPEEKRTLRQRFKELPAEMPTHRAVRTELRKGKEEAKRRAAEEKAAAEARKARQAEEAALLARSRNPGRTEVEVAQ